MEGELHGKAAVITGGSRGIGRAIAIQLASLGANVAVGYLKNDARAAEVVKTIAEAGGTAIAIQADLARPAAVRRFFDEAAAAYGGLDIVVASAADMLIKPLADCSEDDYHRIFDVNVKGVFFTMKEAAGRLNTGGRIIVVSTGGTRMFFPDQSLYLGSKGAIEQFVRVLAWELAGRGITVNAVSPGPTETDMMQDRYRAGAAAKSPFNRIAEPGDVAEVVAFLAGDGARWVTAQNIAAGGGAF